MTDIPMEGLQIRIFNSGERLAAAAAEFLVNSASEAVRARGRALMVLAGGSTPRPLYRQLFREPTCTRMPWSESHFFWGDERAVPPDDPQSNYGSFCSLVKSMAASLPENLHRIKGELPADQAAAEYSEKLSHFSEEYGEGPRFDLVFLGLGSDGHTASLFPGSLPEPEEPSLVAAVSFQYQDRPSVRITLTPRALNRARRILFLVTGVDKAGAVKATLEGEKDPLRYPSHRVNPVEGTVHWFLDEDAASRLSNR